MEKEKEKKRKEKKKHWQGCGENGTLTHCWWVCKMVQPFRKSCVSFFEKLNINLPMTQKFYF